MFPNAEGCLFRRSPKPKPSPKATAKIIAIETITRSLQFLLNPWLGWCVVENLGAFGGMALDMVALTFPELGVFILCLWTSIALLIEFQTCKAEGVY